MCQLLTPPPSDSPFKALLALCTQFSLQVVIKKKGGPTEQRQEETCSQLPSPSSSTFEYVTKHFPSDLGNTEHALLIMLQRGK